MIEFIMKKLIMNKRTKIFCGLLITLSTTAFFNPLGIFNEQTSKLVFYISICLVSLSLFFIRTPKLHKNEYPLWGYFLLGLGFFTGFCDSVLIHQQSAVVSFIALLPTLFSYFSFFIFYKLNIPKDEIIRIIKCLCILSIITFLINSVTYPLLTFGNVERDITIRGGIPRLGVQYILSIVLILFYNLDCLARYGFKRSRLIWVIACGFIILMSLTRQIIVSSAVLGALIYLVRKRGASKFIVFVAIIFIAIVIVPQTSIYNMIVETTETEAAKTRGLENNVRVGAWEFYTMDAQESVITQIFGNGVPSLQKSEWGKDIDYESIKYGFFPADVGWAGFFFNFGIIGVVGLLYIFINALRLSRMKGLYWICGWLLFVMVTSVSSGPIVYYYQIVEISLVLYLVYGRNSNHNLGIQQCKRYS